MKQISVGIVGLGFIGMQHLDGLLRIPQVRIVAVCHRRKEAAQALCARYGIQRYYTDWREMIADPEVECIHNCTPPALHDAINRAIILAGKHVYAEKPLSQSAQQAREVALLARESGIAAGLNHQYRMNAAVQEMRARRIKGLLGKTLAATGYYLQESASRQTDWNGKMENTGIARALNDIGIHWADTASFVLGQPIVQVMADLHCHYPMRIDAQGISHAICTEDTAFVLMRFADHTPGQLMVSKAANGHKNDLQLEIWGDAYSITWRQEEPDRLVLGKKDTGHETLYMNATLCHEEALPYITTPMGHVMGWTDALRNALQAFYDSISDGSFTKEEQVYSTFLDGFRGMAFVEACIRSARERRWVDVEPF